MMIIIMFKAFFIHWQDMLSASLRPLRYRATKQLERITNIKPAYLKTLINAKQFLELGDQRHEFVNVSFLKGIAPSSSRKKTRERAK